MTRAKPHGDGGRPGGSTGPERLQKIISRAGVASRRKAEELILDGRVKVNGRVVTELGTKADPSREKVTVDGKRLRAEPAAYYVLNKPKGVVSTTAEDAKRKRVVDLVPPSPRVNPVGRLDVESEGLMLLTNDGELTHRLTHPSFGVERVYRARVEGEVSEDALARLRRGVRLAEGKTLPPGVRVLASDRRGGSLEVRVKEGLNREVRRILAAVGLKVRGLVRTRLGPLSLGRLPAGEWRRLSPAELRKLRESCSGGPEKPPPWLRRRRRPK